MLEALQEYILFSLQWGLIDLGKVMIVIAAACGMARASSTLIFGSDQRVLFDIGGKTFRLQKKPSDELEIFVLVQKDGLMSFLFNLCPHHFNRVWEIPLQLVEHEHDGHVRVDPNS